MEPKWNKGGSQINVKKEDEKTNSPSSTCNDLKAILARVGGRLEVKKVVISLVLKAFRENHLFH